MLTLELTVFMMAGLGTIFMNYDNEKKATSHKKDSDGDLDSSKLKYPNDEKDEEGE